MKRLIGLGILGLLLTGCASNQIYAPIRVSCTDMNTGKREENTAVAGITVGTGWWRTDRSLLEYTDTKWQQVTIDLTHERCGIAAYRDDIK